MAEIAGTRDGRWAVGGAGAVRFAARGDALELEEVTAEPAWSPTVRREQPDRLEVEFRRGGEEWELDVTYRKGILVVGLEHEQEEAEPGCYAVGDAGEVELAVNRGRLELVEVHTNPGWSMEVADRREHEVEVAFRRGALEWEFEARLSKRGRLAVAIETEIEGPLPVAEQPGSA